MLRAKIKRWYVGQGYGFARPLDRSDDVFVHYRAVDDESNLEEGDLVDLEYKDTDRGRRATFCTRVTGA
jgi:cold shock CspA family protein